MKPSGIPSRNVLYINTPGYLGGAEISLLTLMSHLRHYRPFLVTANEGPLLETARRLSISAWVKPFPWFSKRRLWEYPAAVLGLAYLIKREQIAIVHTNCDHSLRYILNARKLVPFKWVAHVRDFVRSWYKPAQVAALNGADRVIANSHAIAAACIKAGIHQDRLSVIYNPIDIDAFRHVSHESVSAFKASLKIDPGALIVSLVGQIQPIKGHLEFIRACLSIGRHYPQVHFLIVGDAQPEHRQFLDHLVSMSSAFASRFHFLGFRYDIPVILRATDILAIPSWTEPFGRVAVEGMAAGCAIVATACGGLGEIVEPGHNALIIEPRNPGQLEQAIERLILDQRLRDRLVSEGFATAQRFNIASHISQVEDLYNALLESTC